MRTQVNHFLTKAFPFTLTRTDKLFLLVSKGMFTILFLTLYGPFHLSGLDFPERFLLCSGYGIISMAGMGVDLYLLPQLFTSFQTRRWSMGRQLLQYVVVVLSDSIWCTYYSYYTGLCPICSLTMQSFLFFLIAIALSTPPITLIQLLIVYTVYLKKSLSQKEAQAVSPVNERITAPPANEAVSFVKPGNARLSFSSENGKDILCIYLDQIVYISSEDNYCTICYWEGPALKNHLIRSSLKRLESQLQGTRIRRCHRSYLVNLDHICKADGNAHGYRVFFPGLHASLPVSKTYSETLLSQLLLASSY